jgi:hypothetical protein
VAAVGARGVELRLGQRRRGALEPDARELVHAHHLDQRADVRLRPADAQRAPADAQAAGQHGQVEHQRRVGEHELGEIDDDVVLGADGADERLAPAALRGSVLISAAAQNRRFFIEIDDRANLAKAGGLWQGPLSGFRKLREDGHH